MRIACPSCNATYQVPDAQLATGRVVRCARCGTDWTPSAAIPPDEPAEVAPEPEPEPAPVAEEAAPVLPSKRMALDDDEPTPVPVAPMVAPSAAATRRRLPLLPIAWVVSVAVVAGAAAALVVQRDRVMSAWPPSIRGYAAVGLAPRHGADPIRE